MRGHWRNEGCPVAQMRVFARRLRRSAPKQPERLQETQTTADRLADDGHTASRGPEWLGFACVDTAHQGLPTARHGRVLGAVRLRRLGPNARCDHETTARLRARIPSRESRRIRGVLLYQGAPAGLGLKRNQSRSTVHGPRDQSEFHRPHALARV